MNTSTIVQKLWNYCNVLRDDGMSYGDYVKALDLRPAYQHALHAQDRSEIVEDLEAALEQFREIAGDLGGAVDATP